MIKIIIALIVVVLLILIVLLFIESKNSKKATKISNKKDKKIVDNNKNINKVQNYNMNEINTICSNCGYNSEVAFKYCPKCGYLNDFSNNYNNIDNNLVDNNEIESEYETQYINEYENDETTLLETQVLKSNKTIKFVNKETKESHIFKLDEAKIIGRLKNSVDLFIEDESVSRKHALILAIDDKVYIKDLESKNKTYINEKEIDPSILHEIYNSDSVTFANKEYVLSIE